MWPDVSVIIPYFDNPQGLRQVIDSLRQQDYEGNIEIIVADDGSPTAPEDDPALADVLAHVTIVHQDDLGFRAAAARNLGAGAATGEIYSFLDGDTYPRPGYISAVVGHIRRNRRALVVGSRLSGHALAEPRWLVNAWRDTNDLADTDSTSWRYIISAVLTCSASFFWDIGGFDPTLIGYGGEDWEFGWRAWNAGAQFVHEPGAIAEHPNEDFGGRYLTLAEKVSVKNAETIALAKRITHPTARPAGVRFDTADVAVVLPLFPGSGVTEAVISSWLTIDSRVYVEGPIPDLFAQDSRITAGSAQDERITVTLNEPWALIDPEVFYDRVTDRSCVVGGGSWVVSRRSSALNTVATHCDGDTLGLHKLTGPQHLETLFTHH